ncbi:hypothetical protein [Nocardia alni]|uniref:hypothetical protein n=1 Tax=Nocardia alni TaxID=2815723 RepID=UPI001C24D747|nr:hypothetical protein [Nocardia alni]
MTWLIGLRPKARRVGTRVARPRAVLASVPMVMWLIGFLPRVRRVGTPPVRIRLRAVLVSALMELWLKVCRVGMRVALPRLSAVLMMGLIGSRPQARLVGTGVVRPLL